MVFKVFDKKVESSVDDSTKAVKEMTKALKNNDIIVSRIEEVLIHKNEITFITYGHEMGSLIDTDRVQIYYFDIKNNYLNNGGDDLYVEDIDWSVLRDFYNKYAEDEDAFIDAIDHNSLADAKKIHKRRPDILPSIADSFYARWLIKTNNIKFLEWAKSVDKNIDFSDKSIFDNPLKLAIDYKYEKVAIWLLDNYPEISLKPKNGEPLQFIKEAHKNKMFNLVDRMRENKDIMDLIVKSNSIELLPDTVQDIFVF